MCGEEAKLYEKKWYSLKFIYIILYMK
jgi:hypothetical protein